MSNHNTRTASGERWTALVCLLGVLVALLLFALVGHAIVDQIRTLTDTLDSGSAPSWLGGA